MAKKILSKKTIKVKEAAAIVVRSYAYGEHKRAARGSKTPAKLNETLSANTLKIVPVTSAAKEVLAMLKIYGERFREKMLWQQLVAKMWQSKKDDLTNLLLQLKGLELNRKYALERFGTLPSIQITVAKRVMTITLNSNSVQRFKDGGNSYYYEVCVLCFCGDKKKNAFYTERTEWMNRDEGVQDYTLAFKKPAGAKHYLICLKLQSGKNKEATDSFEGMGIRVVEGGCW